MNIYQDSRERHVNSYIHQIIQYVKNHDRPVHFEEIERKTLIKLNKNEKILSALSKNPRIEINTNSLLYKPLYNIRNENDLLELMKSTDSKFGIEMEKILDSPINLKPFIENLKDKKIIYILKDSDNSEILFLNKLNLEPADEKIKNLWDDIKVPNYSDIIKELSSAGIKVEQKFYEDKKNIVKKKSKVKRFKRKIKITNTHVKGLNLNDLE